MRGHVTLKRYLKQMLPVLLIAFSTAMSLPAFANAAPDAALQQSLISFFSRGVVWHGASAELIRAERWPDTRGPVRWSLPVSLHGHPKRLSLIAEQHGRRWYIPVTVRWWTTAIVMSQSVSARTLLTQAMLKRTRTDIAGHRGQWIDDSRELVGMRVNRHMEKGDLILTSFVKRPPLIKRGELVRIMLDMGGLHIRTEGKALRTAGRGERLLVRNLRSNEVVQAIAEAAGTVRVNLNGVSG